MSWTVHGTGDMTQSGSDIAKFAPYLYTEYSRKHLRAVVFQVYPKDSNEMIKFIKQMGVNKYCHTKDLVIIHDLTTKKLTSYGAQFQPTTYEIEVENPGKKNYAHHLDRAYLLAVKKRKTND